MISFNHLFRRYIFAIIESDMLGCVNLAKRGPPQPTNCVLIIADQNRPKRFLTTFFLTIFLRI